MSNRRVLLLNRGESVIDVIDWQTAVCLLVKGSASVPYGFEHFHKIPVSVQSAYRMQAEKKFQAVIESDENGIERGYFLLPTAIVLVEFVHVPYRRAAVSKKNVLKRDKFTCAYCGIHLTENSGTIDHVIPQSKWAEYLRQGKVKEKYPNNWKNVVASCQACNCHKDNRTPEEAGMTLRIKPFVPSKDYLIFHGFNFDTYEVWNRWVKISDHLG